MLMPLKGLGRLFLAVVLASTAAASAAWSQEDVRGEPFVQVNDGRFVLGGKPYRFVGTNLWYGMNLAMEAPEGDPARLERELTRLEHLGVTNLRVMASSEGPNTAPYRMRPAMQPAPGQTDPRVYRGLDVLLARMHAHGMKAVLCLGDFWQWSGGFAQYVSWAEGGSQIPYPDHGDYDTFTRYVARFYSYERAEELYAQHVASVVNRINTVTGRAYRDDPTIMAWQLANEPRGVDHPNEFIAWVKSASAFIRQLDHKHLITTGSEGLTPYATVGTFPELIHALPTIDYMTFHIWIQNWGWYAPERPESYAYALAQAADYLKVHTAMAERLGKPAVLEEFGIARDQGSYLPTAPTAARDQYYRDILSSVVQSAAAGSHLNGVNFWAWGGEGRSPRPGGFWQAGDPWTGDPPHEAQGWYSVNDQDTSTTALIGYYAAKMQALSQ